MVVPGELFPPSPLELEVAVTAVSALQRSVSVEYRLTNKTPVGISGCANTWEGLRVLQGGGVFEITHVVNDGRTPDQFFRIPPFAALSWRREVSLPSGVRDGMGQVVGLLQSDCEWLWRGIVQSKPLTIEIPRSLGRDR